MNGIRSFASDRLRIILFFPEGKAGYFFVIFLRTVVSQQTQDFDPMLT